MAFTLKRELHVGYSDGEQRLFALLPTPDNPRDTKTLVKLYYGKQAPINANKILIGMLASLRRKVHHNREPFTIKNTKRSGPKPMSFWIERRKSA